MQQQQQKLLAGLAKLHWAGLLLGPTKLQHSRPVGPGSPVAMNTATAGTVTARQDNRPGRHSVFSEQQLKRAAGSSRSGGQTHESAAAVHCEGPQSGMVRLPPSFAIPNLPSQAHRHRRSAGRRRSAASPLCTAATTAPPQLRSSAETPAPSRCACALQPAAGNLRGPPRRAGAVGCECSRCTRSERGRVPPAAPSPARGAAVLPLATRGEPPQLQRPAAPCPCLQTRRAHMDAQDWCGLRVKKAVMIARGGLALNARIREHGRSR